MVENNFEYTAGLINKINKTGIKKYNLVIEIAMFFILLGAVLLFVTDNIWLGVIFSILFIVLLAGLVFANLSITMSNKVLIGQHINIKFKDDKMSMTALLGEKTLYNADFEYKAIKKIKNDDELIFVYFDKVSVVVMPKFGFKTTADYKRAVELLSNNYII